MAIERVWKNLETPKPSMLETHGEAIHWASRNFIEFCLFCLCDRGSVSENVEKYARATRDFLQKTYGGQMFVYQIHAAFWLESTVRMKRVVNEIKAEMERRAFLKTLSTEFKLAWMIRPTGNAIHKTRISPITTPYTKHTRFIAALVAELNESFRD